MKKLFKRKSSKTETPLTQSRAQDVPFAEPVPEFMRPHSDIPAWAQGKRQVCD